MAPMTAFQVLQGIETLPLRMARHVENTEKVVAFLAGHEAVERVHHPSVASHPDHALAQRLYPHGCSAILSFDIRGGREAGKRFIEGLSLFSHLANIGDAKSLVIHPASTTHFRMDEAALAMFKGLTKKPKVKAIGEIGLDFFYDHSERDVQRYWFRRQVQLAMELDMPIVIHDRDANDEVMSILKEEGVFSKARAEMLGDAKLLMHCFSGSKELALQYVKLGATISIAGPVTYKNARKNIEVVEAVPLEHLLIETDAPYLTPEPFRGKTNRPDYVEYTARKIAEIKGISYEEAARSTCDNAKKFFSVE
jgi:TatD DNase family protein